MGLLIDHLVEKVDEDLVGQPGYEPKRLSAGARNLLKGQPWTGNVREAHNVLTRASLWTSGPVIGKREVEKALDTGLSSAPAEILGRPLSEGFQVQDVLDEVARHYVQRALDDADGVKRGPASALRLGSATTLSNWMAELGLPADPGRPSPLDGSPRSWHARCSTLRPDVPETEIGLAPAGPRRPGPRPILRGPNALLVHCPSGPVITALEIENFKAIGPRQRIEPGPDPVLFGPNSAGGDPPHALLYLHTVLEERGSGRGSGGGRG